jgi:hypothetical protein
MSVPASASGGASAGASGGASAGVGVVARALVRRPNLWWIAAVEGLRLARPGWWKAWPPIPVPSESLWRMRMLTAYGKDGSDPPRVDDILSYLQWCRTAHQWKRG